MQNIKYENPTAASPTATLPVEKLIYFVNELLRNEENTEDIFIVDEADVFTVPLPSGGEETLYIFIIGDLEICIFAEPEDECFIGAYVRSLMYDDEYVELQMISFAGALLAVVEPNEYMKMLEEAIPPDKEEAEESEEATAMGEAWSLSYKKSLINIRPNQDAT